MIATFFLFCGLGTGHSYAAQTKIEDVKGSERTTLLNLFRKPVEKDLGVKVRFKVTRFRKLQGFAFCQGELLDSKDRPIDLNKTKLKADAEYMDGNSFFGLAQKMNSKSGKVGQWKLKVYAIGPTDVVFASWPEDFGCPKKLLGLPESDI